MKIIADVIVDLPYKLDYCAQGPDVDPIACDIGGFAATLYFPPSLSETTDGQGIFGDWSWWTGRRLRLWMEKDVENVDDIPALRDMAVDAADELLRRFLKSYRWRFGRADVYPVRVDPREVTLLEVHDDGTQSPLPEPVASFFYQTMPDAPPLATSINSTTVDKIARDIVEANEPPISLQFDLDAEALEAQGDFLRADLLRGLARMQVE